MTYRYIELTQIGGRTALLKLRREQKKKLSEEQRYTKLQKRAASVPSLNIKHKARRVLDRFRR